MGVQLLKTQAPAPDGKEEWKYLESRPHPWRKELYVRGQRLPASNVWSSMVVNGYSLQQAAENWGLPLEVVKECVRYSESHEELLNAEAAETLRRAEERGIRIGPETPR